MKYFVRQCSGTVSYTHLDVYKRQPTRAAARQLVSHKHITVDGEVVNIPSFAVKPGQLIGVRERSKSLDCLLYTSRCV